MTNPQFSHLPAVNCPDWAPKAVRTEFEALMGSQAAIETKRAEVLEALHKARNQDLAVFTPVQYDGRPMMQAELQHRRAVAAYLRNLMASSSGFKDQCIAEERRAREEVKARLVKAGYTEPGDIPGRGDYTPDMVNRHELVRCATEKCGTAKGFDLGANIRENQQHVDELTAKLSALREAVIS